jgi:hypothetical protein
MNAIAEFLGAVAGLVMRVWDWLIGVRRDFFEHRR